MNEPYWMIAFIFAGVLWFGSLCFGRLYLGVHSPTDVQGGVVRVPATRFHLSAHCRLC